MRSGLYILRETRKILGRIFMSRSGKNATPPVDKSLVANNKGFTLAEVLVALTLLAVGVIAVVCMFTVSMHANLKANQYTAANNLAQEALEDILAKDITDPVFASANSGTTYGYPVTNPGTNTSAATTFTVTGAGTYTLTYTITLGTVANGIGTENASVLVNITGSGIVGMNFTGFKRLV